LAIAASPIVKSTSTETKQLFTRFSSLGEMSPVDLKIAVTIRAEKVVHVYLKTAATGIKQKTSLWLNLGMVAQIGYSSGFAAILG